MSRRLFASLAAFLGFCFLAGCSSDLPPSGHPKGNLFGNAVFGYVATQADARDFRVSFLESFPKHTPVQKATDYVVSEGGTCSEKGGQPLSVFTGEGNSHYRCHYRDVFVVAEGGKLQEPSTFYEITHDWMLIIFTHRGMIMDVSVDVIELDKRISREEYISRSNATDLDGRF